MLPFCQVGESQTAGSFFIPAVLSLRPAAAPAGLPASGSCCLGLLQHTLSGCCLHCHSSSCVAYMDSTLPGARQHSAPGAATRGVHPLRLLSRPPCPRLLQASCAAFVLPLPPPCSRASSPADCLRPSALLVWSSRESGCPLRYFRLHYPCQAFLPDGRCYTSAWLGSEISDETWKQWLYYVLAHDCLPVFRMARSASTWT